MIYQREDPRQLEFKCAWDEVCEEGLVLAIDRVVDRLDLAELYRRYSEAGSGFYDPGMQLKVWFLAYCEREWHCRDVAKRVKYDVRFRYFTGSCRPDFRTLNRFRHDHLDLLPAYFAAIVAYCEELGLVDASVVALDGTKVRANASGRKRGDREKLRRAIRQRLERDVLAEEEGEPEGEAGATLTPEGSDDCSQEEEIAERAEVVSYGPSDVDARYMKTSEGSIRLCYNAQVVVDRNQIIVAADVGMDTNDKSSFRPLIEQSRDNLQGEMGAIVTDKGYDSGRNLKYAEAAGLDVYWPTAVVRQGEQRFPQEAFIYDPRHDRYRCPQGEWLTYRGTRQRNGVTIKTYRGCAKQCSSCALKAQCTLSKERRLEVAETQAARVRLQEKVSTPRGEALLALRQGLVEPVFGNLKFNLGFTRFNLRGLAKVKGEFLLLCIAHNLKKIAQFMVSSAKPYQTARDFIVAYLALVVLPSIAFRPRKTLQETFRRSIPKNHPRWRFAA